MSKTVVVYKSKYGSTKKYAEWIAKALNADIFETSKINVRDMEKYSTIIYGGGLYASGISGISTITKAFDRLKNKKLIVFTVGIANPKTTNFNDIINKNFTPEMQQAIKVFHLRGAIDYKKLNFIHRAMMAMMKNHISKTPEDKRDEETKMMLETYGKAVDFTNESTINPLVEEIKKF